MRKGRRVAIHAASRGGGIIVLRDTVNDDAQMGTRAGGTSGGASVRLSVQSDTPRRERDRKPLFAPFACELITCYIIRYPIEMYRA